MTDHRHFPGRYWQVPRQSGTTSNISRQKSSHSWQQAGLTVTPCIPVTSDSFRTACRRGCPAGTTFRFGKLAALLAVERPTELLASFGGHLQTGNVLELIKKLRLLRLVALIPLVGAAGLTLLIRVNRWRLRRSIRFLRHGLRAPERQQMKEHVRVTGQAIKRAVQRKTS